MMHYAYIERINQLGRCLVRLKGFETSEARDLWLKEEHSPVGETGRGPLTEQEAKDLGAAEVLCPGQLLPETGNFLRL
jgi:hypothetical protein